ncbi:(p)ppGpp synthetase [Pseudomonas putida]|uniref:GTP pyrophosphokinase n=1 Tax=Pseudomonas putida TaxID=303 RepID=UPI00313307CE
MTTTIQLYNELKPKLDRLKTNIESALNQTIGQQSIPLFAVESRIKDEKSLTDKIEKKRYSSPLEQIEDLCGIRVICYYQEDISKICDIVEREFSILKKEDKRTTLNEDQFGYTSCHYIVQLRDDWLTHPGARGLEGLKAEIQIRTMLMHAWAAISHKLLYKKEDDVPVQIKRQLNRLSALIELADEQFDAIKEEKTKISDSIANSLGIDGPSPELTSDSLVAIWQKYSPEREFQDSDVSELLEQIRLAGYDFKELVINIEKCLPILPKMEKEEAEVADESLPMWTFGGLIRTVLDLTSDNYYHDRKQYFAADDINERYRSLVQTL